MPASKRRIFVAVALLLACFSLLPAPQAFGVSPPPDGDYGNGNTAEGANALFHLTTGGANTAIGTDALFNDTSGSSNTAIGQNALLGNQTGDSNTATGLSALQNNTTGHANTATGVDALLSNTIGISNTADGLAALQSNTTGEFNTAIGIAALEKNIGGGFNTATGASALDSNISGNNNTADGLNALFFNTSGSSNTATGVNALLNNTTGGNNAGNGAFALQNNKAGHDNTADGFQALKGNTSGNNNVAIGSNAGANLTTGGNNIDVGANVPGAAGEANTIRIGKQGTQKNTFIAGISGVAVSGSTVVVNSNGKLGVATSSARFKEAIKPMDKTSEAILALKPVSFRYKEEIDPDGAPQFGLIAEEVEKVNPALVGRDENGKVNTVRYEAVNAMLLNEFLKEHRTVQEQESTITNLKSAVTEQGKEIQSLTAAVRKLSNHVEGSKPGQ